MRSRQPEGEREAEGGDASSERDGGEEEECVSVAVGDEGGEEAGEVLHDGVPFRGPGGGATGVWRGASTGGVSGRLSRGSE